MSPLKNMESKSDAGIKLKFQPQNMSRGANADAYTLQLQKAFYPESNPDSRLHVDSDLEQKCFLIETTELPILVIP